MGSFSYTLKCKLQPLNCLTLIGTEGRSISQKIGCSPETLRDWVNKQGIETGDREGLTQSERVQMKELQRENRELKQANDILRKASAFFAAADLDRLRKR
jgi:transposase